MAPEIAVALIATIGTIIVAVLTLIGKLNESRHQSAVKTVESAGETLRKKKNLEIHQLKVANKTLAERLSYLEAQEIYLKTQLALCLQRRPE
jgi:hypothetical protein